MPTLPHRPIDRPGPAGITSWGADIMTSLGASRQEGSKRGVVNGFMLEGGILSLLA